MALEETIEKPATVVRTKRRARQILIIAEEGRPYIANFTREKKVYENGILVQHIPDNATIQRVFAEDGSDMDDEERLVMSKLKALNDGYAAKDGEP